VSVRIRLRRMGAKKNPFYRIIVADSRKPRDGRYIESIGTYDPLKEPSGVHIEEEKLFGWLKNGAQPSDPVWDLLSRLGLRQKWEMLKRGQDLSDWQPPAPRTPRKKRTKAEADKAAAAKETPEEAEKPAEEKKAEPVQEQKTAEERPEKTAKAKEDKKKTEAAAGGKKAAAEEKPEESAEESQQTAPEGTDQKKKKTKKDAEKA